jgi:hypothetical protein
MKISHLLEQIRSQPELIQFDRCIEYIDKNYIFSATDFKNGPLHNDRDQNQNSCKIFAFGLINQLTEPQTLACFGHYYRKDVLQNPAGDNHQNIRQFMRTGWKGIHFNEIPLVYR